LEESTMTDPVQTPMLDKVQLIPVAEKEAIGAFLEWLDDNGYTIAQWRESRREEDETGVCEYLPAGYYAIGTDAEAWITRYYEIDQEQLAREQFAVLEGWRNR
jgi:hypothetical protein